MTPQSPQTRQQVLDYYQLKLDTAEAEVKTSAGQWSSVGYVRGLLLLVSIALLGLAFVDAFEMRTVTATVGGLLFVVFVLVALYHENLQTKMRHGKLLTTIHRESIARLNRDWDKIKVPPIDVPDWFSATSKDLDLLGDSSVYKLLGVTRTPLGTQTLQSWIIEGALADEVKLRQEAVAELKPEFDWRLDFRFNCEQLADSQSGPSRFIDWAESESWFRSNGWVLWIARLTAAASILAILGLVAAIVGLIPGTIPLAVLGFSAAINFAMAIGKAGSIHDVFNQVSSRTNDAARYVDLFDMIANFEAKSKKLKDLQAGFQPNGDDAQSKMKQLGQLIFLANIRRSGALFAFYMVFQFFFFWDAHALDLLERWKTKHGSKARDWFDSLGQTEALAAIAKFAGDHPEWVFPEVKTETNDSDAVISGRNLGHPLLGEERVCNDVEIGPPGTVLLVTGSNMSGKSTLLRSVGANIVLAQLGAVVCASEMKLPPMHIETSMRIADSLADGVSFFMAELKRLKEIVDSANAHTNDNPRRLLFLLDEILQGTNSRERQVAVSRVVRKLIDEKAIGAISTHDLDLATTDDLAQACQTVHFAEQFSETDGKKTMTFDYQMKPGVAKTTNALKLLEMVGLGE